VTPGERADERRQRVGSDGWNSGSTESSGDTRADLVIRGARTLILVTGDLEDGTLQSATTPLSAPATTTSARRKSMRAARSSSQGSVVEYAQATGGGPLAGRSFMRGSYRL
jgi:hypothetical protein